MRLGTIGAWCAAFTVAPADAARPAAREIEALAVSRPRQVGPRGHRYTRAVATMRAYVDAMDDDPFVSPDGRARRGAGHRVEALRDAGRRPLVGDLRAREPQREDYCGLLGLTDAELGRLREDGVV